MATKPKDTVRRLVTLPVELAAEVDHFKDSIGASSDSDALKVLIGWGLTRNDKLNDLFSRCRTATEKGLPLGDIITSVISDHPLVDRTTIGRESVEVYLKSADPDEEHQTRFRFDRAKKEWEAEYTSDHGRAWYSVTFQPSEKVEGKAAAQARSRAQEIAAAAREEAAKASVRLAPRSKKAELDDDIPF